MAKLNIRIDDTKLDAALRDPKLIAGPVREFLEGSGATVEAVAKARAPVSDGRLRASIKHVISPMRVVIAPHVSYAGAVEFGTKPHWPPVGALKSWARKHGFGPAGDFLVRRAISRHGTKAQPFMEPALEDSRPEIKRLLADLGRKIEKRWSR